jgi:hypothetical protein
MTWGNRFIGGILALAALGMLAISAAIDFRFGSSFGRSEVDGWLLGGASALAGVVKAAIPFALARAFSRRHWVTVLVCGILWSVCVVYSFSSATGFGFVARTFAGDATTLQAGINRNALAALQSDQGELEHVRSALASTTLRTHDRMELEQREAALSKETAELRSRLAMAPSVLTATTQADALANMLGIDPSRAMNGLVILLASLLELVSGFGLFVGLRTMASDAKVQASTPLSTIIGPRERSLGNEPSRRRRGNVVKLPLTPDHAIITAFLNLLIRSQEGSHATAEDLRKSLEAFCGAKGLPIPSWRRVGEALRQRGYAKDRRGPGGRVRYLNVEISDACLAA